MKNLEIIETEAERKKRMQGNLKKSRRKKIINCVEI